MAGARDNRSVARRTGKGPDFAKAEIDQIRRFPEETDVDELSDEMLAVVEKYWQWLLDDIPPRVTH
jgi:hypothetical protein